MSRSTISRLLFAVGFFALVVGAPIAYVATVLDDGDAFVAVADEAFAHPEVRRAVAEIVVTATIEVVSTDPAFADGLPSQLRTFAVPASRIAANELTDAAFALLDTDVATQARQSALRELHAQITTDDADEITIDLNAVLVRSAREIGGPAIGVGVAELASERDVGRFVLAEEGSNTEWLLTITQGVPALASIIALVALVMLAAAVIVAPDRRAALITAGGLLVGAALTSTLLVGLVLALTLGSSPVMTALTEVIVADFARLERGTVITGGILAATGLLLGNRPAAVALRSLPRDLVTDRGRILDRLAAIIDDNPAMARLIGWALPAFVLLTWSSPTWRVVITVGAITAGFQWFARTTVEPDRRAQSLAGTVGFVTLTAFVLWPGWDLSLVRTFLIVGLLVQAAVEFPAAYRHARLVTDPQPSGDRAKRRRLAVAAAVVAVLAGSATVWASHDEVVESTGCNGDERLCDRRIDELTFAGSHNSMSSNDLGWQLAMQDGDIIAQLDHGVRALLIDALYWRDSGELDGGQTASSSAIIEAALSDDEPQPGTWLCHGFCALGATDLTAGLTDIDLWLDAHPREVLLIIVQDEISFDDLEAAFVASGLRDQAFVHQVGTPFPTLKEMIDADTRLMVFGENQGESDTWFQNGYADTFVETPYAFDVPSDFTCEPNRGGDDHPLFLINHWITTGIPVREAATLINSRDVLLDRVAECEAERGRRATIVAVDFVETGDLIDVVAELNGVR